METGRPGPKGALNLLRELFQELEANHVTVISWQGPERFLNLCHDSHAQKSLSLTPQL